MSHRSPSDAFWESATAFRRWSKNSFGVAPAFARLSSASAKFGSSEIALSKCWMESCPCSFSASSRPCRNSFFAASDAVVTGILPLSGAPAAAPAFWPAGEAPAIEANPRAKDIATIRSGNSFRVIVSLLVARPRVYREAPLASEGTLTEVEAGVQFGGTGFGTGTNAS